MGIAGAIFLTFVLYRVLVAFEQTRSLLNSLLGTHLTEEDALWAGWSSLTATKEKFTILLSLFVFTQCFIMVAVPSTLPFSGMAGKYANGSPFEILFSIVHTIWYAALPYLVFKATGVTNYYASVGILFALFALQCLVHLFWDYGFGTFWKFKNRPTTNGGGSIPPKDLMWKLFYRFVGFYYLPWRLASAYANWFADSAPDGESDTYRKVGFRNGWFIASLLIRVHMLASDPTSSYRQYLSIRQYIPDRSAKEELPGFFDGMMNRVSELTGIKADQHKGSDAPSAAASVQ